MHQDLNSVSVKELRSDMHQDLNSVSVKELRSDKANVKNNMRPADLRYTLASLHGWSGGNFELTQICPSLSHGFRSWAARTLT